MSSIKGLLRRDIGTGAQVGANSAFDQIEQTGTFNPSTNAGTFTPSVSTPAPR